MIDSSFIGLYMQVVGNRQVFGNSVSACSISRHGLSTLQLVSKNSAVLASNQLVAVLLL